MSAIKLYHSPISPNARRVRIFLAEKDIKVEIVPVDLGAKEQFSDAYRAINPRLQVPALVLEDGTSITEVPAIWRYLELVNPSKPLLGTTAKEQGVIAMWERRIELDGFAAVMEAVRNTVAGLKGRALSGPHAYEQIPALAERSRERIVNFYADLNTRLETSKYVAGDTFSVADITALVTIDFATVGANLAIPKEHAATQRWYDEVSTRPSAKA
ncbi:glutathione S-transferase [Herbaspirillum frisingense]|uniref:glutathione S-transferase family protein n=1 Tax=Herbaspirillum frisingense TaxID=92645 RepID=UPI0016028BA4|nr:glutathione S-transferase [Herbaspirillum frisingense]QNB06716.1 glutathione S-transferase [Herbaspirillum frisingense]